LCCTIQQSELLSKRRQLHLIKNFQDKEKAKIKRKQNKKKNEESEIEKMMEKQKGKQN
jgi:hypothetical protein